MLFRLSVKNFKKSIRDYSIYFFTMILGIAVFYIFNAIETQTAMMEISETKASIVDMMNGGMEGVSILVSFILGYLVVYASRFMLKKRKKEFGIYMTLGMSRSKIAGILWMETVWMGLISLGAGLAVGVGISQFMSLFVSYLFQADMSRFVFVFSGKAAAKCAGYFLIIYLIVMLLNTVAVGRAKLIDFMTANRKKEKNFLKNPWIFAGIFVAACLMLGYAYYNVTAGQKDLNTEADVFFQILLGILGTFLVFWSLSGLFVWVMEKIPGTYYKGLNSFVFGEITNKLNSGVFSCSIICLLIFMTICLLFSAFARKEYKDRLVKELAPADISMVKEMTDGYSVLDIMKKQGIKEESFTNVLSVNTYRTEELTNKTVLGSFIKEMDFGRAFAENQLEIMHISTYNEAARRYGLEEYQLGEKEYRIVANIEGAVNIYNGGLRANQEIQIKGETYHASGNKCADGFLMMSYSKQNEGIVLVPDSVEFTEEEVFKNYVIADYKDQGKAFQMDMDKNFAEKMNPENAGYTPVYSATKSDIYDDAVGSSAMYIFLGLYLGICFLISGAAVLSLKILSDTADSRGKYLVLRKLGCRESQIRRALWKQNGTVFLLPLLLAGIHSVFGLQVCRSMLSVYDTKGTTPALLLTGFLIVGIYGGYYLLSQICCEKMVKE